MFDFRKLSKVTVFYAQPMPDPEEIFEKIGQSMYFTKLVLWRVTGEFL